MQTGILILAAGNSSRLGYPKQIIEVSGSNLLNNTISMAESIAGKHTLVVLGAYADQLIQQLKTSGAIIVHNQGWEEGMASSIRTGIRALNDIYPELEAVICMVCDQPFVTPQLLQQLVSEGGKSGKGLVACEYNGITGVPVLFKRAYFGRLLKLEGAMGAKTILQQFPDDVLRVCFEKGVIDIDTKEDLESWRKGNEG